MDKANPANIYTSPAELERRTVSRNNPVREETPLFPSDDDESNTESEVELEEWQYDDATSPEEDSDENADQNLTDNDETAEDESMNLDEE